MKNWYRRSILYSLDVEAFMDGDGDGIGDFTGLRKSLPYLSSLGVDCLWLLPFFGSPNRDNGYDVMDYFAVDPRLGNLGTFTEFMDIACEYNIRVIIDLVVNHTSDQHPWFREALKGPSSAYYDYYIWTDKIPDDYHPKDILGKEQSGNWQCVDELGKYYYHTFYKFQPDLNLTNPRVREEIKRIMHFWLQMGVSGFRMDAVTHMIRKKHGSQHFDKPPHDILAEFRRFTDGYAPHALLLAEADVPPDKYQDYFHHPEQMHLLFNFYGNNYLFYSLVTEKARPLVDAFKKLPDGLPGFANFIRNHDELDLERLSSEERQQVFECYAPSEDMRIFGRGIRRRFASMVNEDRRVMELAYSLLLSLPGMPVLRYGQEIGMGDDLRLPGREAVRTVMQWSDRPNGGFSSAPSDQLVRPVIEKGPFSYKCINVNKQVKEKDSFLAWMTRAIAARRRCPEFGMGTYRFVESHDDEVMIHRCEQDGVVAVAVHNFGSTHKTVNMDIDEKLAGQLIDFFSDTTYPDQEPVGRRVEIGPKGYRWFKTSL